MTVEFSKGVGSKLWIRISAASKVRFFRIDDNLGAYFELEMSGTRKMASGDMNTHHMRRDSKGSSPRMGQYTTGQLAYQSINLLWWKTVVEKLCNIQYQRTLKIQRRKRRVVCERNAGLSFHGERALEEDLHPSHSCRDSG